MGKLDDLIAAEAARKRVVTEKAEEEEKQEAVESEVGFAEAFVAYWPGRGEPEIGADDVKWRVDDPASSLLDLQGQTLNVALLKGGYGRPNISISKGKGTEVTITMRLASGWSSHRSASGYSAELRKIEAVPSRVRDTTESILSGLQGDKEEYGWLFPLFHEISDFAEKAARAEKAEMADRVKSDIADLQQKIEDFDRGIQRLERELGAKPVVKKEFR